MQRESEAKRIVDGFMEEHLSALEREAARHGDGDLVAECQRRRVWLRVERRAPAGESAVVPAVFRRRAWLVN